MKVIRIAQIPAPQVSADATVVEAVRVIKQGQGGACVVVYGSDLIGIFTERDVMLRVVDERRDPETTAVSEVMSSGLRTVTPETDTARALELMVSKHIRHLPVVDEGGDLLGLLPMRNVLRHHVEELVDQLNSLEAYFSADGPGG